jgi:hypothetical protein
MFFLLTIAIQVGMHDTKLSLRGVNDLNHSGLRDKKLSLLP